MNGGTSQILVDLSLILRVLAAFSWGWGYGLWLHKNKKGMEFERKLTFLATIVGLGVDLLIAFNLSYWEVVAVIAASAVGVSVLALVYGYPGDDPNFNSYKLKWGLEDAVVLAEEIVSQLTKFLAEETLLPAQSARVSKVLARAYQLKNVVRDARKGEYSQKNTKA